ncbi:MAG: cell division FtsA domain-containing protein [Candidatus Niyogibacteria bacterium]|nr:cell division FtsA domain-containing protein [Candidatus Niyogibacteria bacterium]
MGILTISTKEEYHLSIFIGTGSVNALLYALQKGKKPRILEVFLRPHSIIPTPYFGTLQAYVKRELEELTKGAAATLKGKHIRGVHVLLASPWYFSQTRIVTIKKDIPFVADKKTLKESLDKETETFLADAGERFSGEKGEYRIVEMSFMRILMNGYEVNEFLNKHARELTLDMYISLSLRKFIEGVDHVITSHFSPREILFYTAPFVFFKTIKQFWSHDAGQNIFDVDEGVVVVDIGGEVTDVTIIRKGIIEETFTFGKGMHFIVRRIASAFSLSPKDAFSLFRAWEKDEVAASKKTSIESLVVSAIQEWRALFEKVLREASDHILLPANIIVAGEGAYLSGFSKALQGPSFQEFVLQHQSFRVTVLEPKLIRHYFDGEARVFAYNAEAAPLYLLSIPIESTQLS